MAGRGPAPTDGPKLGRYQSPLDEGAVEVPAGSFDPPKLPYYREYKYQTKHWWDTWLASPQVATFTGTDWQRLLMLAPLVESYYRLMGAPEQRGAITNAMKLMTEIRMNESLLGATHLDRLRGRIKIDRDQTAGADDDDDVPENVAIMNDYRKELGA